jgi:hypothetical protein
MVLLFLDFFLLTLHFINGNYIRCLIGIDIETPCILQKNMFSLLLCNIYLHKWNDPAPEAQANSTIWGPPLRQSYWVLPGQLSTFQMWDETLADSSLLNKAPSKGGGGKKEQQRERTQVQARSTKAKVGPHRAKEQMNVGFVLGKTCEIYYCGREEERQKNALPKGLETWLPTWMDYCLSSFENSMQDSHPSTHQLVALPFHFWNFAKW